MSSTTPQSLASPSLTSVSTVAVCRQKRGSRRRSRNLVVSGMPTIHNCPSKILGSIGLIRGNPSERRVASMHKLPVAAWRRVKMAAIRGAAWVNSIHVVMGLTLGHAGIDRRDNASEGSDVYRRSLEEHFVATRPEPLGNRRAYRAQKGGQGD